MFVCTCVCVVCACMCVGARVWLYCIVSVCLSMHVYECNEYLYFRVNMYVVRIRVHLCVYVVIVCKSVRVCDSEWMCDCVIVYVSWCRPMCVRERVCECVQVNSLANNAKWWTTSIVVINLDSIFTICGAVWTCTFQHFRKSETLVLLRTGTMLLGIMFCSSAIAIRTYTDICDGLICV